MASSKRSKKARAKSLKLFPYIQILISLFLVIFGAGVLVYISLKDVILTSLPKAETTATSSSFSKPIKLYLPAMSRILYVTDGYVEGNRWVTSQAGVSFLTSSALPGGIGNTVIYGHNTRDILGGLWRVHEGDYIYVVLASGDFVKYQVYERKEIEPTQVEILNQTDDSRLTLYTCSGFLDTARFVVVAKKA